MALTKPTLTENTDSAFLFYICNILCWNSCNGNTAPLIFYFWYNVSHGLLWAHTDWCGIWSLAWPLMQRFCHAPRHNSIKFRGGTTDVFWKQYKEKVKASKPPCQSDFPRAVSRPHPVPAIPTQPLCTRRARVRTQNITLLFGDKWREKKATQMQHLLCQTCRQTQN